MIGVNVVIVLKLYFIQGKRN